MAPLHEKTLRGRYLRISPADSWHQPTEDSNGILHWKPRGHHRTDENSTPDNLNEGIYAKILFCIRNLIISE